MSTENETGVSPAEPRRFRAALRVAAVMVAYFLAHQLAFLFPDTEKAIMALWPAGGIGLAALLLSPVRLWPAIVLGLYVAGVSADVALAGRSFLTSFGYMTANVVESLGCAWLITRGDGRTVRFCRVKEVLALIAGAVFINAGSACIGAGAAALGTGVSFQGSWLSWYVSDGLGIILVTPLIVAFNQRPGSWRDWRWDRVAESIGFMGLFSFISWQAFQLDANARIIHPRAYMVIALLVWPALRLGPRVVAMALVVLAGIAITSPAVTTGPLLWGGTNPAERLLVTQLFLGFLAPTVLLLSAGFTETRSAQTALRSIEGKFERIFNSATNPSAFTDAGGGKIINVNDAWIRATGIDRRAAIGSTALDLGLWVNAESRAACMTELAGAGSVHDLETPLIMKSRELIFLVSAELLELQEERFVLWEFRDITDRRLAEIALRESQHFVESVLNTTPELVYIYDLEERRNVYSNREMVNVLGYTPDQIRQMGDRVFEMLLHPDDASAVTEHHRQLASADDTPRELDYRMRGADGQWRWIHSRDTVFSRAADGTARQIIGAAADISERKRVEEELRRSHDMTVKLTAQVPGVVYQYRLYPDGRSCFPWSSSGMQDIYEVSSDEVREDATPVFGRLHPDDLESTAAAIHESARTLELFHGEFRVVLPRQGLRWRMCDAKPERLPDGGTLWYGIITDITVRKRAEETLRTERDRTTFYLAQTQALNEELTLKNKELEQIVFAASHDLRAPLVNIQGFGHELKREGARLSGLMRERGNDDPPFREIEQFLDENVPHALGFMLNSSAKMDSLLTGLLKLARLGRAALSIARIDVNALTARAVATFEFAVKAREVTIEVEALPDCLGDAVQIEQVFTNLLDNALKYLSPSRPGVIRISGHLDDGRAIYCIEDNGIGVASGDREKIFEMFHRLVPDAAAGEGLGLNFVTRILARQGGKVWVESEPGVGSRFFVSLPGS